MRKGVEFEWNTTCQKAFEELRERIANAPVLGIPRLNAGSFILTTDASFQATAACLSQVQGDKEVTLAYWSKTLNPAQKNYCVSQLELLAVVEGIAAFDEYLAGATFVVRTDHKALQWLTSFKNLKGRLARWVEELAAYHFVIEAVPGTSIPHVDALSRIPDRPCSPDCRSCNNAEAREQELKQILHIKWMTTRPDDGLSAEQLARDQRLDPDLMPIIQSLMLNEKRPTFQEIVGQGPVTRILWHQYASLVMQDGLLKRRFEHPLETRQRQNFS